MFGRHKRIPTGMNPSPILSCSNPPYCNLSHFILMCIILPPAFQYSPERSSSILLACCVLHNASLQSGLDAWTLERTDPLEQPESLEQRPEDRDSQAEELRKQLILKHFSWDVGWTNTFSFVDVKGDQGWIKGFILGWFHGYFSNA